MRKVITQQDLNDALMLAAMGGNAGKVGRLLKRGARADAADGDGRRALHWAAWRGHGEVAKVLMEGGACTDIADNRGNRPLHFAAEKGRRNVVKLLLGHDADPTVLNNEGKTPRDLCSHSGIWLVLEDREMEWAFLQRGRALAEHLARQRKFGSLRPKGPSL